MIRSLSEYRQKYFPRFEARVEEIKRQPHYCPDWDFMLIGPDDPEMDCCTCDLDAMARKIAERELHP